MKFNPDHPSHRAEQRVHDRVPIPTSCPYCSGPVIWVNNREIYGKSIGDYPYTYVCKNCMAYVGIHKNTSIPFGTLADRTTRQNRKGAKGLFMKILRIKNWDRSTGYSNLATLLGIDKRICHFGMFNNSRCRQAKIVLQIVLMENNHEL